MTFTGDVSSHLHAVGEPDAGDLTNSGVRLPWRLSRHFSTHTSLKWGRIKSGSIFECIKTSRESRLARLARFIFTSSLGQLIDCCHLEKEDP